MPNELTSAYNDPTERKAIIRELKRANYNSAAEWQKIRNNPDIQRGLQLAKQALAQGKDQFWSEYHLRIEIRALAPQIHSPELLIEMRPWAEEEPTT